MASSCQNDIWLYVYFIFIDRMPFLAQILDNADLLFVAVLFISIGCMPFLVPTLHNADLLFAQVI